MSKFHYAPSIPAHLLGVVKMYFDPLAWMIPAWCQKVTVSWCSEGFEDAAVTTQVQFEYRWASIVLYPCWLDSDDTTQKDNCIHEMLHLHLNPLYDYANNTLAVLLNEDETFRVHSQEALRKLVEGAVQDLTATIFRRIYGDEKETIREAAA